MSTAQVFVYTTSIIGAGEVVSTVSAEEGLNAFGVRIRYHSTDFPSSTSSLSSSSPSSTSKVSNTGSGTTGSPTGSGTSSSSSDTSGGSGNNGSSTSSSGGLSTGAKAGIGIGAALGALAFLGVVVWLIIRNRRAAAASAAAMGGAPPGGGGAGGEVGYGGSTINSPGSGGAYTEMSTDSPALEQQKYYYAANAGSPMVEAPGQSSWTPPIELPTENQHLQQGQPEYR